MTYKISLLTLALILLAACTRGIAPPTDIAAEAQRIARESIVVDTHIDVPGAATSTTRAPAPADWMPLSCRSTRPQRWRRMENLTRKQKNSLI